MGRRSDFKRRARDKYPTPREALTPLLPFLTPGVRFLEPCAGDGRLAGFLTAAGLACAGSFDIEPDSLFVARADALTATLPRCDVIVTNPPWSRPLLHGLIHRLRRHAPTWLLFDAAWQHTQQARVFGPYCSHVVSVGRVSWMENDQAGKDDAAWYRFVRDETDTRFIWRV
jgi:hypothetical protein